MVSVTLDNKQIEQSFNGLKRSLTSLKPALDQIGARLVLSIQRRFETSKSPEGKSWKPSIRVQRAQGAAQTLVSSGRLLNSFSHVASDNEVRVGTNVIYAKIHQFGGVIKPKKAGALRFFIPGGGFATVKKVVIPARPFFGFSEGDKAAIQKIVTSHIKRAANA